MEITQVIVAYRNPFEMWLWESGAIYIWIGVVSLMFCYLGYYSVKRIISNRKKR